MQYSEGRMGRIFMIRIDDGEDLLTSIDRFIVAHKIRAGMLLCLGALREARIVTGPEEPLIPPVPHFEEIGGGWELFGVGTIYRGDDGSPRVHYHASVGRGEVSLTGCLREKATTYLVVEVVLFEFQGIYGRRAEDMASGVSMPFLKKDM